MTQIVDNRALVLRTRNPDKFNIIPKSKYLGEVQGTPGIHEVAVFWSLDEAKVLRNLGVRDVPSPILGQYEWPGKYSPMAHQKETAAFLTLQHRAFVFNEAGCVDSETEYLSPTGWKKISEYTHGEVAQYYPDSGRVEFVTPDRYVKLPCAEMVKIKTKYGVDQMLSPEHRVLVRSNVADKWRVLSAAELLQQHDEYHAGTYKPGKRTVGGPISFGNTRVPSAFYADGGPGIPLSDALLRVQTAVIADGYFPSDTGTRCVMRLKKERKKERIRVLLKDAGIQYTERACVAVPGFSIFTFYAPLRVKEFDAQFWAATKEQLAVLSEECLYWDGTHRVGVKGPSFSSTSKASADFVQYAWSAQGRTARIIEDKRAYKYTGGVCYTVNIRGEARGSKHGLLSMYNRKKPTMGVVPSTDGFKYCFTVPTSYLVFRRNGCIFASGNTGKSLACLWAADYLMRKRKVRRVLIVAPLSIMHTAWMGDISKSIIHRSTIVAHHPSASRRIEMIQSDHEIVIVNYDGLPLVADEIVADGRFDLIICDECTALKNHSTRRWRTLAKLLRPDVYLWLLTGTPAAQSPLDAYGLAKLINPTQVPFSFAGWRDKVMSKLTMFKWVPKPNAKDEVFRVLQPAIRFTKEQCLDLPPVIFETREVPMTAQQQKYYKLLKEHLLINTAGESISAVNAAAGVSKLLQISAGASLSDSKEVVEFDVTPRLNTLLEVLEETERKVLIFSLFRAPMDVINEFLTKRGIIAEQIHGDVTATKRADIIHRFQTRPETRVLILQPAAAAHGITLTAADTVVFYGPVMSVEMYWQAIARSDRKGQDSTKVRVVHIESSPIEQKMFKVLRERAEDHQMLTRMFDNELKSR